MLCSKFGWNSPNGLGEGVENVKTLEQEELGYILTTKANLSLCYMGVRPIQHCVKKSIF